MYDTNYQNVIKKITGKLPKGKSFSFQTQLSKHALPEFGREWLPSLHNFFLIRNPKEVIISYQKILHKIARKDKKVNQHDVGIHYLYKLFKEVEEILGETPLVIDSTDLIKNPTRGLKVLCNDYLGVTFSEKMLTWELDLKNSNLLYTGDLSPYAKFWYSQVSNSEGFMPYKEKEVEFPEELLPLLEGCLVLYQEMYQSCRLFNN
uniref:sulfotransferase-like domain-containing protein n=1 Tax=Okeania sp. SIO2F4 TaxID=2607790 RepID=UPI003415E2A6